MGKPTFDTCKSENDGTVHRRKLVDRFCTGRQAGDDGSQERRRFWICRYHEEGI